MIGIIGGTGLYRMEGLEVTLSREIATPFGRPSGPVMLGRLAGREIAFLPGAAPAAHRLAAARQIRIVSLLTLSRSAGRVWLSAGQKSDGLSRCHLLLHGPLPAQRL